jgi:peptide/nickel transport system substrate-binding protein
MKSRFRTRLAAAGLLGAVAALAAVTTVAGPAIGARSAASHPCVVATGSGDQAFTRNFNPWQSFGNSAMDFTAGGIYENLVITTAFGGGHQYNLLAKSLDWSKNGKTLTITVQPNVVWSDG